MTNVTLKPPSAQRTSQQASLEEMFTLGSRLLTLSIENSVAMMQQAVRLLPTLPIPRPRLVQDACCEIPETECPPRCACEVTWQASPGETPGLSIRVTNSSKSPRIFGIHATPFIGVSGSPGTATVAPTSLTLAPGHSGFVNATFTVPNVAEGEYDAEIVVQGAYEQAVCVKLDVKCEKTRGEERVMCDVVVGDPPVRIRAHHWYDHFQCTEPCFEPQRPGNVPPNRGASPGSM